MPPEPLPPELLRRSPEDYLPDFTSTEEIPESNDVLGQDRALAAIDLSAGMEHSGYNMFVMGVPGSGRHSVVQRLLRERAADEACPPDWIYVHNFAMPHRPNAISLPAGRGTELRRQMEALIEDLNSSIPALFDSDEYRTRRNAVQSQFDQRHESVFEALRKKATEQNIVMMQTPQGFAFAPLSEGEVMRPEAFQQLSESEQQEIQGKIETLQKELQGIIEQLPRWDKERREAIRKIDREVTNSAVLHAMQEIRVAFQDLPEVIAFFDEVQNDLIENASLFLPSQEQPNPFGLPFPAPDGAGRRNETIRRYAVNVIVDNTNRTGAPVITEDNPTLGRLIGRIENIAQFGALMTDFTLIKSGALHAANGGYLLLNAVKVLSQPFAWDTLKRALMSGEVRIESPSESLGLVSTVSLDPEPIPLRVRVVLVGERQHFYLLNQLDPDFADLFKVLADFSETVVWDKENIARYVGVIASMARQQNLRMLDRDAVGLMIQYSARVADDSERLSLLMARLADLAREADYWANKNGRSLIGADDVRRAIDAMTHRADRIREQSFESITRDIMLIDTDGAKVGQINGLSVLDLGNFRFGRPTRITARIGLGAGKLVDIEREVDLGGPLHSKGVMILGGYLTATFGTEMPLSLSASLVFEQSYGGVDGDSASSTELYALLSAISGVPLQQSLAVTGSVNQYGAVQAIGGVNEKIEGFFDICNERGLTGYQGVLIPKANTKHLMLRPDVVEAVKAGQFKIYAVERIEDGIEILTGTPAGAKGEDGRYPEGSIYARVHARLREMADLRRKFGQQTRGDGENNERDK
ncbi:MAG: AAA family ATPase [Alphaproteobacteria bacterium]|nr:AAA family ATPase [Alphaproteobacteria bacterium]